MANNFLAGLMTLAFCFIFALPAYAQNDPAPEKIDPELNQLIIEPFADEQKTFKTKRN